MGHQPTPVLDMQEDMKQVPSGAQPVLTTLVKKVNSPEEVENLLQRFARQPYDRYGAAVCQIAAVRDLLADGMLASIDPNLAVRQPSEEGEIRESTNGDVVVMTECFTDDHVSTAASYQGGDVERSAQHDHELVQPASEPSISLHLQSQSPLSVGADIQSDSAGAVNAHHGLPAAHDTSQHREVPQFGQVSRLTSKYFEILGDSLGDRRDWSHFQLIPTLYTTTASSSAGCVSANLRFGGQGQSLSTPHSQGQTERAALSSPVDDLTTPAQTAIATQVDAIETPPTFAQINPARANLMQSQSTEEFVPWFREEEHQPFQPTGANFVPLNSALETGQMEHRHGMGTSGRPTTFGSQPSSIDQSQAAKGSKHEPPHARRRKRKRAPSREETPTDTNFEPKEDKTVVLNLLDPTGPYENPAHQKRIVKGLAAKLAERINSYLMLGGVPGVTLPRLNLQGRMPDGARIDFDCRARVENANDVRELLTSILLRSGTAKQKRVECDKILRHVARWNPALFPEFSSSLSNNKVCLRAASPDTYKSFLDVLTTTEDLRLNRPLRAINGYSIASRIFDAARQHVRRHAPGSSLLQDPAAKTLFAGAGYNAAALGPVPAKFSLVRGGIGTPRRSFLDALETSFMLQTTRSEEFEAELERLLYCLAEQDKTAWPELFA
ncbi:hypothetical protein LTR78_002399 [Recurvomyces mirabilis]|uniref:Uncharacterized protein n=1 Tax=Recurvomyces mirabilis TaxID=574656 RepID=A0AAE1C4J0_9PEZI|nr:hypothetical protein LTR78_002399 [Recurvomyces mirabilis]KAK5157328.1 hypothetical protein LTS14_004093 [Recurvomyces mirabilis]